MQRPVQSEHVGGSTSTTKSRRPSVDSEPAATGSRGAPAWAACRVGHLDRLPARRPSAIAAAARGHGRPGSDEDALGLGHAARRTPAASPRETFRLLVGFFARAVDALRPADVARRGRPRRTRSARTRSTVACRSWPPRSASRASRHTSGHRNVSMIACYTAAVEDGAVARLFGWKRVGII